MLLLDEPFAALDSLARNTLIETMQEILGEADCAVVLVTHDWREVRRLAERAVVLFTGRVVQAGDRAEIEQYPASADVAALVVAGT